MARSIRSFSLSTELQYQLDVLLARAGTAPYAALLPELQAPRPAPLDPPAPLDELDLALPDYASIFQELGIPGPPPLTLEEFKSRTVAYGDKRPFGFHQKLNPLLKKYAKERRKLHRQALRDAALGARIACRQAQPSLSRLVEVLLTRGISTLEERVASVAVRQSEAAAAEKPSHAGKAADARKAAHQSVNPAPRRTTKASPVRRRARPGHTA